MCDCNKPTTLTEEVAEPRTVADAIAENRAHIPATSFASSLPRVKRDVNEVTFGPNPVNEERNRKAFADQHATLEVDTTPVVYPTLPIVSDVEEIESPEHQTAFADAFKRRQRGKQ